VSHPPESDPGAAGQSARREYERRRQRRLSGPSRSFLLRALVGHSPRETRRLQEERHWASGARGEELLAASLERRCPEVLLLHDRRMPRSRANIDHIAIAASGVYVIDTKRHHGKIRIARPLFGSAQLRIAGRDRTKLIDGLDRQVGAVKASLADFAPDVAVHGCLCFVAPEGLLSDVGLPLLGTLKMSGYELLAPRKLARRLRRPGAVTPERALAVHAGLATRLPAA
jgi:hypothetical protein